MPPALNRDKKLLLPFLVGLVVILLNLQWMEIYQLVNAPQADSLVYLSEAYRDYWLLREHGVTALVSKYVIAAGQQTSPMLWWGGMAFFLLFGLDPVHAYWFIAVGYLGWVAGAMFLAKQIRNDSQFIVASGLLAAVLPSVVSHGLRSFMVDFVAAVPFVWATAFLLKSDLLSRRHDALMYGVLCGITVLFRTTIMPFFLAHAVILLLLLRGRQKKIHWSNASLAVGIGVLASAWFLLPNVGRIVEYYGYWAKVAGMSQASVSFADNLAFYLGLLPFYHLTLPVFILGASMTMLAIGLLMARHFTLSKSVTDKAADSSTGFFILLALGLVPMLVLSFYPSRASSVDFPYVVAFLLMPPLLWRMVLPGKTAAFWGVMSVLMLAMFVQQAQLLLRAPSSGNTPGDFREREAIKLILADAERRGLKSVTLGNTAIHQHNSLGYQYWVLANYFPHWRGKVEGVALGRTDSPEELAKMNKDADYVIVLENHHADWHPNNRAAPAANKLLVERYNMRPLATSLALPDGVILRILARQAGVQFPSAMMDGWYENNVPVVVTNPSRSALQLELSGRLFHGAVGSDQAVVSLHVKANPAKRISFVSATAQIDKTLILAPDFFDSNGRVELVLESSWAGKPAAMSLSPDTRVLAFSHLRVAVRSQ